MRRMTTLAGAVLILTSAGMTVGQGTSSADPQGHQVTYTVTAQNSTDEPMITIGYIQADPPSKAAYNADPAKYLTTVYVPITPGDRLEYNVTLSDPGQWALVRASGARRVAPEFHCELSIDGQVVVQQDGGSQVTCAGTAW